MLNDSKRISWRGIVACSLCASLAGLAACSPSGGYKITPIPADQTLKEQIVFRDPGWVSARIAMIDVDGILLNAAEPSLLGQGEHVVSLVVEKLDAAAADDRVKAVVLRVNSPGGTVTASDILYEEVLAFRKKTGKPVIAYFQDVAASGAYYLACASDEIVAQRTSVTGSIGVMMQMVDLSGTLSKLGIEADAIKSGPFKDAGSPFREMRSEERAVFQGLVDQFYEQFVDVVTKGRPKLTREQVLTLADGRVYSAPQALETGLIDRIATLKEAVQLAKEKASVKAAHTIAYHRPLDWSPNVYSRQPTSPGTTINLINLQVPRSWTARPEFLYLWSVGG